MELGKSYTNIATILLSLIFTGLVIAFDSGSHSDGQVNKRQPIPMPRIGRSSSTYYMDKKQSLIPAPRIGRRDEGGFNKLDCSIDSNQCENVETGAGGSSGMMKNLVSTNEDLMEPLDIQLRAAFIPRLGKRATISSYKSLPLSSILSNEDLVDQYKAGMGRLFGYFPRNHNRIPIMAKSLNSATADMVTADEEIDNIDSGNESKLSPISNEQLALLRELLLQEQQNKRTQPAPSYWSRIGRAVFAPRIGKKAAFVPRIG